ncbi:MAG: hypothetical protein NT166_32355 [Candidatus Aminicenantes bacterium]|nr:hypothetical protein [Candidatus Aminicenantes bacterium]
MIYALEERIGRPELFVGRKKELEFFLEWINGIKMKKSMSTALLARRKMGKTAILERLFNIIFFKNDGVIPFYYEIKETKMWALSFYQSFFLTFIYQYIAFKSRKTEYLDTDNIDFSKAIEIAQKEGLDYLVGFIEGASHAYREENVDALWELTREAPKKIASRQKEFIVQMIDEFQFLETMIYRDKECKNLADKIAGGYLSTAESKFAPLLVSGSWVGWLMNMLMKLLPSRFRYYPLENMPQDEAFEMVYKYSQFFNVPVTEETAYLTTQIAEGSPFYISSIFRSGYEKKDLTTIEGLSKTLEFETLDNRGIIKYTWMEYIKSALPRINDKNAKRIVLYLCKHRDREVTRKELQDELKLDMPDTDLELKLEALVKSDIIAQGQTAFDYRGVSDNIFDKVFRGVYQKEIEQFDVKEIKKEYDRSFNTLKRRYRRLQGKYNYQKGYFAEYLIVDRLRVHADEDNEFLKSITRNLPCDFNFSRYSSAWKYNRSPENSHSFNIDIFARAEDPGDYSLIGEVKCRDVRKFSKEEVDGFLVKFEKLKAYENLERALGFIFSRSGFTQEAENYCKEKGIAYSEDQGWLENS